MNNIIIKGRLTADPVLSQTPSGVSVGRFTVAVNAYSKDGENKADFIRCTAWRNTAEFICKYFSKGQEILCRGALHNNDYTDANGIKHYSMDVTVDNAEFCGNKNSQNNTSVPDIGNFGDYEEILGDDAPPF